MKRWWFLPGLLVIAGIGTFGLLHRGGHTYLKRWQRENCFSEPRESTYTASPTKKHSAWVTNDACEWGGSWHRVLVAQLGDGHPTEVFVGGMVPKLNWLDDDQLRIEITSVDFISTSLHQLGDVQIHYAVVPSIALPSLRNRIVHERVVAERASGTIQQQDLQVDERFESWVEKNLK